jgi:hypothetical protein
MIQMLKILDMVSLLRVHGTLQCNFELYSSCYYSRGCDSDMKVGSCVQTLYKAPASTNSLLPSTQEYSSLQILPVSFTQKSHTAQTPKFINTMQFFATTLLALAATTLAAPSVAPRGLDIGSCCATVEGGQILTRCVGFDPSEAATLARRDVGTLATGETGKILARCSRSVDTSVLTARGLDVGSCCATVDGDKILTRCVGFDPSEAATLARRGDLAVRCS